MGIPAALLGNFIFLKICILRKISHDTEKMGKSITVFISKLKPNNLHRDVTGCKESTDFKSKARTGIVDPVE